MRIGIDCDEVIFPLLPNHCLFLNKKYSFNLDWKKFTSYNFWEHYNGTRERAVNDFIEFTSTEEFMKTTPNEGSQEGARELRRLGELYLITSRPDKLREKTQEWIDMHFKGLFDKLVFGNTFSNEESKRAPKSELCRENNIRMLFEDHYDAALDVAKDIPVMLFDKPWNQRNEYIENITRVKNWAQAVEVAKFIY